jgi:hypothetical protein
MNDRARFDVLVAPRVGSVIEAQQQAFAMRSSSDSLVLVRRRR